MNQYAFRRAAQVPKDIDADTVGEELHRIWEESGERLEPADVVQSARHKASPLHPCFEWNNAQAGERWRLVQARQLIKCVRVVAADGSTRPAFVHVRIKEENVRRFYQSTDVVVERPTEYAGALAAARRKLAQAKAAFDEVEQLIPPENDGMRSKVELIAQALATAHSMAAHLQ